MPKAQSTKPKNNVRQHVVFRGTVVNSPDYDAAIGRTGPTAVAALELQEKASALSKPIRFDEAVRRVTAAKKAR